MALFPDLPPLPAALIALGIVLALVWLAGRLAPRLLGARLADLRAAGGPGGSCRTSAGGAARLSLLETLPLGASHRLHLIRCDGRDVVLLTGGPQDVVVGWLAESAAARETGGGI